ncbi:DUF4270 domain-containing protein [Abyssalbus ytuae]|uniref:DUF4270 family protein n=1 Tax=Abyssalbus ytuae TaxID=2926907 RepID=A0A9E6ZVX6_9FLAO|nr:DUF4270 domain-containing protein [Abyssalbus ytuae]UOB16207.1 DUF4270 family protein [Abyssalbus ytuae]
MKLKKINVLIAAFTAVVIVFMVSSCDKDSNTIGAEILGNGNYETKKAAFDVIAYNRKLKRVRTNGLSHYQLGSYVHPVYGRTKSKIVSQLQLSSSNPRFGVYTADKELENYEINQEYAADETKDTVLVDDEMETITGVYLNIPFFSDQVADSDGDGANDEIDPEPEVFNSDADGDGVIAPLDSNDNDENTDYDGDGVKDGDESENGTSPYLADSDNDGINDADDSVVNCSVSKFELDSIFGNRDESFTIKISRVTDYIQSLDPDTNFQDGKMYFSDDTFNVDPTPLFESNYQLTENNYIIERPNTSCDNDETAEDESITCETIPAGIRIKLNDDVSIFQEILNKEGSDELFSNDNFEEYFRGLMIEVEANNLLMLLNVSDAFISMEYTYKRVLDVNRCEEDAEELREIVDWYDSFRIELSGQIINLFEDEAYPGEVTIDEENPDNLYVKGGSGTYVELNLFDEDKSVLDTIPSTWLINEANLVFHVNKEELANYSDIENPSRLYLYDLNNEAVLIDYNFDFIGNTGDNNTSYSIYGGIFEDNDTGPKYKFRITEHINRIIRRDSTNTRLGLFVTSNIRNVVNVASNNTIEEEKEMLIPQASIINPFGTILYGANGNVPEEKRLRLEIYYTKP